MNIFNILKIKDKKLFDEIVELYPEEEHGYGAVWSYTKVISNSGSIHQKDTRLSLIFRGTEEEKKLANKRSLSLKDSLNALTAAATSMRNGKPLDPKIADYFAEAIEQTIESANKALESQHGVTTQETSKIAANTLASGLGILANSKRAATTPESYSATLKKEINLLVENHPLVFDFDWGDKINWDEIDNDELNPSELTPDQQEEYCDKTSQYSTLQSELSDSPEIIRQARIKVRKVLDIKPRTEGRYWQKEKDNIINKDLIIFGKKHILKSDNSQ